MQQINKNTYKNRLLNIMVELPLKTMAWFHWNLELVWMTTSLQLSAYLVLIVTQLLRVVPLVCTEATLTWPEQPRLGQVEWAMAADTYSAKRLSPPTHLAVFPVFRVPPSLVKASRASLLERKTVGICLYVLDIQIPQQAGDVSDVLIGIMQASIHLQSSLVSCILLFASSVNVSKNKHLL